MYIIIDKITHESTIIKEKTTVSTLIGKSVSTIYRNETKNYWETNKYFIYNPKKVLIKSNRGGKNSFFGG
jgi:predicted DNA-binding transcriptional regulator AlpA